MKGTLIATTKMTIHATPPQVWRALTTPELVKKYMMGADVKSDWRVGSPLVYTGQYQGKPFEERGVIKKLEPEKILQATHFSASSGKPDVPENYELVTWILREQEGETVVEVSQDNIESETGVQTTNKNWTAILTGLKRTVEDG